jgi:hypothetical protein
MIAQLDSSQDLSRLNRLGTKRVLIQMAIATLAAMPSAYAGIDATTTSPSSASLPDSLDTDVVLAAHGGASPAPETVPGGGGAFFSPFAMAAAKPARRLPERAWYLSSGSVDLTLSVATSLAAVAAFAYILRRASR